LFKYELLKTTEYGIFKKEDSLMFTGVIVQKLKDGAFGLGWFLCRCLSSLEAYATYYPFKITPADSLQPTLT
jgi:hypothetical protein